MKTSDIVKLLELAFDQGYGSTGKDYDTTDEHYLSLRVHGIQWLVKKLTRMTDDQQNIKLDA